MRTQTGGGNGATHGATVSSSTNLYCGVFVDLQIEGQMVACLVNTGSAISLINRSVLQCSPALRNLPSQGTTLSAVTANGLPIQVSGTIEAQVKVASELITHKSYIANDITGDGILGMDFLKPLGTNVDLGKSCLRLQNSELLLRYSAKQIAIARVVLKRTLLFPPTTKFSFQQRLI